MAALKWLVGVMGVLIVAGTVTLVVLIVQRLGGVERAQIASLSLGQPPGSRIAGLAAAEGLVAVWVARPDGDRILLVDPRRGGLAGEVHLGE